MFIFFMYNFNKFGKEEVMAMTRATIRVDKKLWEQFKKRAKRNNSDASKEIRKFIEEYLKRKDER